jgi:hypothetical protein
MSGTSGSIPGGIIPSSGTTTTPVVPRANNGPCVNLECQRHDCVHGGSTTISGTVYDPAGKNPIYNVAVYVPNEPLQPLKTGASCDTCSSLYTGTPVAAAVTDANGKFSVTKAPDGANIPLVIQVGKWRKQLMIPSVAMCQDNPLPDKSLLLPKNHMEGDIPNIAISTGGADTLECLLRRVGVDASEYVPGAGATGRIHIFAGSPMAGGLAQILGLPAGAVPDTSPPSPMSATSLWDSATHIMGYDIVLLSCEGEETLGMNQQVLHDYASAGGRVFASHFHYSWFNTPPYANENLATWTPGANSIRPNGGGGGGRNAAINGQIVTMLPNGQPFPKGQALNQWLGTVGALTNGLLPIDQARHNADVAAANRPSQSWIVADQNNDAPGATEYFSFDTPTDAGMTPDGPGYCGRVVFSDLHVGGASMDDASQPVPTECVDRDLSPQEKALEFMLFDLSSCLTPNDKTPPPPVVQ